VQGEGELAQEQPRAHVLERARAPPGGGACCVEGLAALAPREVRADRVEGEVVAGGRLEHAGRALVVADPQVEAAAGREQHGLATDEGVAQGEGQHGEGDADPERGRGAAPAARERDDGQR